MLTFTSLPLWETSHCNEDLKLVFPVLGERRGELCCTDVYTVVGADRVDVKTLIWQRRD